MARLFTCICLSAFLAGCCTSFPVGPGDESEDNLIHQHSMNVDKEISKLRSEVEEMKKDRHRHFWQKKK